MTLRVTGLEELHKALKVLGGREARRARTNAVQSGTRVLAKAVKAAAPVRSEGGGKKRSDGVSQPGELRRSVRVSRPFNGRSASVGKIKMAYWGTILESGRDGKRGVGFPHRGWAGKATEGAAQGAIDKFTADLWKYIANQWERYAKRRGL